MLPVTHWSTSHKGGAAIAARSLNTMLNLGGQNSSFVAPQRPDFKPERFEKAFKIKVFQNISNKLVTLHNSSIDTDPFFSLFSMSPARLKIQDSSRNSLVHLHNTYNLLSHQDLGKLKLAGKTLIITLHDQRLLTGGCHYSIECLGFENGCKKCPRLPIPAANLAANNFSASRQLGGLNLHVISPSQWLHKMAQKTFKSPSTSFHHFENVLNFSTVKSIEERFHRPEIVLGYAAEQSKSKLKGFDFLQQSDFFSGFPNALIRTVTPSNFEFNMKLFWQAIDVLVVPSIADNHPNVISEAHLRGIPVIASKVGGIPEQLYLNFDAILENSKDPQKLLISKCSEIREKYSHTLAIEVSVSVTNRMKMSLDSHIDLYQRLSVQND